MGLKHVWVCYKLPGILICAAKSMSKEREVFRARIFFIGQFYHYHTSVIYGAKTTSSSPVLNQYDASTNRCIFFSLPVPSRLTAAPALPADVCCYCYCYCYCCYNNNNNNHYCYHYNYRHYLYYDFFCFCSLKTTQGCSATPCWVSGCLRLFG